jgi:hypothetical protein
MNKTLIDTSAPHWPQNLWPYTYTHGDTELLCFVDWEPADRSAGWNGGAWLIHAFAGGADVVDMLKDHIIKNIEQEAAEALLEGPTC